MEQVTNLKAGVSANMHCHNMMFQVSFQSFMKMMSNVCYDIVYTLRVRETAWLTCSVMCQAPQSLLWLLLYHRTDEILCVLAILPCSTTVNQLPKEYIHIYV